MSTAFSQESNQPVWEKRRQDYLDYDVSLSVALIIGAGPNTCFDNMLGMFLNYFPDVFSQVGKFIEGWYVIDLEDEVVVNEHGWCELPDGRIIDPTVVILVSPNLPVYYFPGVERTFQEVKAIVQKGEVMFPYVRDEGCYGKDGLGHPAYKAAYDAAKHKVFALANATQPPKRMTFLTAQDDVPDQDGVGICVQMLINPLEAPQEGKGDE
jgi:hypothetical protein